ncbi:electron transfer flavoprotein subunit beta, partial [Streptomyces sp. BE20]|nr:electron transfer flavoprotein subunit beta [Streptomyces sp. BE20]
MGVRIVVPVWDVGVATGDRRFSEDLSTDLEGVVGLLSELVEFGVVQALRIAEAS